jgi:very-short-patch-repair endonuclease
MKRRGKQPWRVNRARVLRDQQTSAEDKLWTELRARRLDGLKFVRQMPIDPCFADFVCRSLKIVVEVDGGTHSTPDEIEADRARTSHFERLGYRVFRVHNQDIYDNIDGVLDSLLAFVRGEA